MKFTCLRNNFSKGLSIVTKAVPVKHSFPILTNVYISAKDGVLTLVGTDLDTAITVSVGASVEEEGSLTVPSRHLLEYVNNLNTDTLLCEVSDDILHLHAGRSRSKFNGVAASDYPEIPKIEDKSVEENPYIEVDPKEFSHAISQIAFSVANDDTRPVFTGVLFDYRDGKLVLAASDGFRLSEKVLNVIAGDTPFTCILPAKPVVESAKIFNGSEESLKIFYLEETNSCVFASGDILISTRTLNGSYPDYKRIIPKESKITAKFPSQSFFDAVKLSNVFSKADEDKILKIELDTQGLVKISSISEELGETFADFEAEIAGDGPFEIIFSSKYLMEFFSNNKHEVLIFAANDNKSPCLITPEGDDTFLHVLAPMQNNSK